MIIYIGKKISFTKKINKSLINQFVKLSGDNNPIHVNEEYAKKTTYKKIVAHGMLSEAFLSTIIGTKLPGKGSLWIEKEVKFLKIVRLDDYITFDAEVISIDEQNRVAFIDICAKNQFGEKVIDSKNKVIISDNCKIAKKIHKKKIKKIKKIHKLNKKTVLLLGSSGGIGLDTANTLLKAGYIVYCQYFTENNSLDKLKKKYKNKVFLLKLDIYNEKSLSKFLNEIRKVNFTHLINCIIPKIYNVPYQDIKKKDFEYYFSGLFYNVIEIINEVTKIFIKNNCGNIIDISTVYLQIPEKNFLPYITYKGAMKHFIKTLSVELSGYDIRSNIITAGVTNTQQTSNMTRKQKMLVSAKTPLKRIANPKDISNALKYLVSKESSFVNGANINVDGGII
jgi:3-oxoacyl-[acyl-carrier protein] reductase